MTGVEGIPDDVFERAVEAAARKRYGSLVDPAIALPWHEELGVTKDEYIGEVRPLVEAALAEVVPSIQAKALRDAADREDAAAPEYGHRSHTGWARQQAEWIERAAGLRPTPNGWCGNKEPHDPHPHASVLFGLLACVGTEEKEEK